MRPKGTPRRSGGRGQPRRSAPTEPVPRTMRSPDRLLGRPGLGQAAEWREPEIRAVGGADPELPGRLGAGAQATYGQEAAVWREERRGVGPVRAAEDRAGRAAGQVQEPAAGRAAGIAPDEGDCADVERPGGA